MEIDIVEAGALVKLPGGHDDRQKVLHVLSEISKVCSFDVKRRPDGRILVRCPERYVEIWPALKAALEDYRCQMRMF